MSRKRITALAFLLLLGGATGAMAGGDGGTARASGTTGAGDASARAATVRPAGFVSHSGTIPDDARFETRRFINDLPLDLGRRIV